MWWAGFDANGWWIRLAPLPVGAGRGLLVLAGITLIAYACGVLRGVGVRRLGAGVLALVGGFAIANVVQFYLLALRGEIHAWVPIPMSVIVAVAMGAIVLRLLMTERKRRDRKWGIWAAAVALLIGFPLGQMFFFGTTDYRRQADAAVVFGARTYADGRPSQALADRVRTAVELYQDGLVSRLIFSGGPGDGNTSEPRAMRRVAMEAGVPDEAIVLDEMGVNTDATVRNTVKAFDELGIGRVLVVSHAYHLPRVKLAYQRAGWEVRTVPARQSRHLRNEPMYVAREVAAIWFYYLRPLV
jgi:vancomycin permeability regulator SanA